MLRPQPRSTLFPYTTLFRSHRRRRPAAVRHRTRAAAGGQPAWTDRKSTRLNSSHVSISYAVFCLKKKKLETQHAGEDVRRQRAHRDSVLLYGCVELPVLT